MHGETVKFGDIPVWQLWFFLFDQHCQTVISPV